MLKEQYLKEAMMRKAKGPVVKVFIGDNMDQDEEKGAGEGMNEETPENKPTDLAPETKDKRSDMADKMDMTGLKEEAMDEGEGEDEDKKEIMMLEALLKNERMEGDEEKIDRKMTLDEIAKSKMKEKLKALKNK